MEEKTNNSRFRSAYSWDLTEVRMGRGGRRRERRCQTRKMSSPSSNVSSCSTHRSSACPWASSWEGASWAVPWEDSSGPAYRTEGCYRDRGCSRTPSPLSTRTRTTCGRTRRGGTRSRTCGKEGNAVQSANDNRFSRRESRFSVFPTKKITFANSPPADYAHLDVALGVRSLDHERSSCFVTKCHFSGRVVFVR